MKAMEEVSGPVDRDRPDPERGVRPGRLHGRHHRPRSTSSSRSRSRISVLLSVVNALTLSPALAAMLLKAPTGKRTLLTPFYNGFNKVFGRATDGYVSFTRILVRKFVSGAWCFIGVPDAASTLGLVSASRPGSCPRRIRATCWSTRCCPTPRRSSAPTR